MSFRRFESTWLAMLSLALVIKGLEGTLGKDIA
jgi:hypothetical protein